MKLNIAIVGAGVSGIILGSLLKKYLNVNISIFEKRNQLFNNINGLQLTPNSTQILDLINFPEIFKKEEFLSIENQKYMICIQVNYCLKFYSNSIKNRNIYLSIDLYF